MAGGRSDGAEDDATLGAREGAMEGRLNTVDGNRLGIRIIFTLMIDETGVVKADHSAPSCNLALLSASLKTFIQFHKINGAR
jgi:hypothetical protein